MEQLQSEINQFATQQNERHTQINQILKKGSKKKKEKKFNVVEPTVIIDEDQLKKRMDEISKETQYIAELPKPFISIDPGFDNHTHLYGYYAVSIPKKLVTLYLDPKKIVTQHMYPQNSPLDIEVMWRIVKSWINQNFPEEDLKNCLTIIERQYVNYFKQGTFRVATMLNTLQTLMYTAFDTTPGVFVTFADSAQCKKFLGIDKSHDNSNTTKQTKAIKFCRKLFKTEEDYKLCVDRDNDHQCDIINQAYYYFKKYMQLAHDIPDFTVEIVVGTPEKHINNKDSSL
jgi:hypothetical protein